MGRGPIELCTNATFILVLFEAVMCLVGCGLIADKATMADCPRTKALTVIAVAGYAIVTLAYLISFISLNEPITCNYFYLLIFLVGAVLNAISGCFLIFEDVRSGARGGLNIRTIILTVTTLVCSNCMFSTVILKLDYLRNRCNH